MQMVSGPKSLNWLLLVGDSASPTAWETQARDDIIALGHSATIDDDSVSQGADWAAEGYDVVWIMESTATGNLDDANLTALTQVVILGNRSYADDIELSSAGGGNSGDDKIIISTSAYPVLTADAVATDLVDLQDGSNRNFGFLNHSGLSSGATLVATLENNTTRDTIVYWPTGATLLTGTAAGPRLFWGLIADNAYGNRSEFQPLVDGMINFVSALV